MHILYSSFWANFDLQGYFWLLTPYLKIGIVHEKSGLLAFMEK